MDPESFYPDTNFPEPPALPRNIGFIPPWEKPDVTALESFFPNTEFKSDPASSPGAFPDAPSETEAKMFPSMGVPETYAPFGVPSDLESLGLVHDQVKHDEFSTLARQMGLSQSAAQQLVHMHLQAAYGRKK